MNSAVRRPTVLVTDYAWPDVELERAIVEDAGFELIAGPSKPAPAVEITALVAKYQPAGILTCWAPVSAEAIAASANLRIVGRLGVGLDNIAVEEASRRGIWVTNVPDYCMEEVSDHAVGMLLALVRGITHFDREVRAGRWQPATAKLRRVSTLTCGILGFGRIGRCTARKLAGFGVRVLAYTRRSAGAETGVELVSLEELLRRSDAVIVHIPLTPESKHLLDRRRLELMRRGAFLVNVSRGAVVETEALIEALQSGRLGGAALDVLEGEPEVPAALTAQPNVILTPHIAFSSDSSLTELRRWASEEVVRVLRGELPHQARNQPLQV
jgi:D-3-phosphoglycerate dehydrogenase